ncbi:MAG: hypothetical protein KAJ66_05825 [Candidatus Omnitrophica bacterium]|nr:hypothetical protein [Candidatus Omnitrophota bacterium]
MLRIRVLFVLTIVSLIAVLTVRGTAYGEVKGKAEDLAKKLAERKQLRREESEILVEGRTQRGIYYFNKGYYHEAIQQFHLVLEMSPDNKKAKSYLNKAIDKLQIAAKKHYNKGKAYYNKGYMQKCIDEMSLIPEGYPYYAEAREYIINAREVLTGGKVYGIESPKAGTQHVKDEMKRMTKDKELVMLRKKAHEQKLMMDVERSYLPPERREEIEEDDEITPEEIAERKKEEAEERLRVKMNKNIVPALSLSDADIRDVIRELVKLTGVNIILNEGALKEASGGETLSISFTTVTPMALLDLLDIALKTTNLAYKVEPSYIWISDKTSIAEEKMVTRTYKLKYGVRSIRDVGLIQFDGGDEEIEEDEDF